MSNETVSARPMISLAVGVFALVGILLALAVGKETGAIDPALAKRGVAIGIGLIMVVTANQLPKLLPPARNRDSGPFTGMSPERFAGWTARNLGDPERGVGDVRSQDAQTDCACCSPGTASNRLPQRVKG